MYVKLEIRESQKRGIDMSISLCMIAYNEADMIGECLRTAKTAVDEIVIGVDSRTTDGTLDVIAQYGVRGYSFEWQGSFSEARNDIISRARGEWILSLDADERLTEAGQAAIGRAVTSAPDMDAFQLAMEHRKLYGNNVIARDWHTRLFKSHLRYRFPVHETVVGETLCQIQTTTAHVIHYGYDPELSVRRHKFLRNIDLLTKWIEREPFHPQANYYIAKMLFERGRVSSAHTYAAVAMHYADSSPDGLSDEQKRILQGLMMDYTPA